MNVRSGWHAFATLVLALLGGPLTGQESMTALWQRQFDAWGRHAPVTRLEEPHWSPSGDRLCYRDPVRNGSWVLVDCLTGKMGPAFDSAQVAEKLTQLAGSKASPGKLPFRRVLPRDDGGFALQSDSKEWLLGADGKLTESAGPKTPIRSVRLPQSPGRFAGKGVEGPKAPHGDVKVELKDGEVHVSTGKDGPVIRPKVPAEPGFAFVAPIVWSPNGAHFAVWRERKVAVRQYRVTDSVKGESKDINYDKPGDDRTERVAWVFDTRGGASRCPSEVLPKAYSTDRLDWTSDGTRLRTEYVARGFTGHGIIEHDVRSGRWRRLLTESSDKFVYTFGSRYRYDLSDERTLWASERSGWNHLYAVELKEGGVARPITSGEWVLKQVQLVDAERSEVFFTAVGRVSGENPYHHHFCRTRFEDGKIVDLTPGDANHEVILSPDRRTLIDIASRVDRPPSFTLRRTTDGGAVALLHRGDTRALEASGWTPTVPFVAKDRDGRFDIWGVVTRPHPFDPSKKYPVIENIYAGPHGSFAPRSFNWWHRNHRELSMLGFYVVQMDGRGTNHRGREFHQQSWRNLRDGGFPDRIAWMKALARQEPNMDLARAGIFGGSAGGQNTAHALLLHGDFYRAGAADCGCYDNRVDKLWWNEQWLGWPVGPWYAENSCATYASRLKGRLLMTVGESDTNVDVKCSYDFRDALLASGKKDLIEFHVVPGANHGAGESGPMRELRARFFQSALGGPLPR
ncbi:MAG: prolyl oligopeptidase family serine peptidase [Opitutia bacterium]